MTFFSVLLRIPRRYAAVTSVGVLAASGAVAGVVLSPAFADGGCDTRKQTISTSYINAGYEMKGTADNTSCSRKDLKVRIQHHDVWARDDTIANGSWSGMSGSYVRSTYGCRNGEATYFSEQHLDGGNSKKSSYRDFDDCQVK